MPQLAGDQLRPNRNELVVQDKIAEGLCLLTAQHIERLGGAFNALQSQSITFKSSSARVGRRYPAFMPAIVSCSGSKKFLRHSRCTEEKQFSLCSSVIIARSAARCPPSS